MNEKRRIKYFIVNTIVQLEFFIIIIIALIPIVFLYFHLNSRNEIINDGGILTVFLIMYILLFLKTFDINKTLNKEFRTYKKYLVLKRKRIKIQRNQN